MIARTLGGETYSSAKGSLIVGVPWPEKSNQAEQSTRKVAARAESGGPSCGTRSMLDCRASI
jgi:hypothetical protein